MPDKKDKKKTDEEIEMEAKAQMADSPAGAADPPYPTEGLVGGMSTSPDPRAMAEADYRAPTPLEMAAQMGGVRGKATFEPEMVPANPMPAEEGVGVADADAGVVDVDVDDTPDTTAEPAVDVDVDVDDMDMDMDTGATGPNAAATTKKKATENP